MNLKVLCSLFLLTPMLLGGTYEAQSKTIHKSRKILKVGNPLPNALLSRHQKGELYLNETKGKVKLISIVPQLNTPVCDEQTHRFSEENGGLDQHVQFITISTNSAADQASFAQKAKINNMLFLSDRPHYDFGKSTGLLIRDFGYLKRTVIVADQKNIIRYVDFVPGGGMPQIKKALRAVNVVLKKKL